MIEVRDVTKRYGSWTAVRGVSFTAADGVVYGLVGYNGAGKTTLLKTIAGVYLCDEGAVLMDGSSVHEDRSPDRAPFLVADEPHLPPQATPDLLRDFYRGYYPRWSDAVYAGLLDLFRLDGRSKVAGFSKGMQRQVVLLLGLAAGSRCLLLDESFDGLDLGKRNLFKRLLRLYARRRNAAVILSSHNLRELEDAVDRVGMIEDHRLVLDATVSDLHERYRVYRLPLGSAGEGTGERIGDPAGELCALLAGSPAVRWSRWDDDGCVFVAETSVEDRLRELGQPVLDGLQSSPATLEEVFLAEGEVNGRDLEGIFA